MKLKNNCVKLSEYFLITIVLLFVIICGKILYIALSPTVDGVNLKELAENNKAAKKVIRANRGNIYDSVGEVLAQDVRAYTVIAYLSDKRTTDITKPKHVIDKNHTANELSKLINMTPEYILELLNYDAYQVELGPGGRGITELKKQQIEKLDLPGIDFIQTTKRDYPYGDFASYIIGYARKNNQEEITGEMGIELKYNEELKGVDGSLLYQKDAYGYQIANTPETLLPATNGYDIHLTIDSNIHMYLENAMMEFETKYLDWGTITVADGKTGAIVGSASYPSFDPNILKITNYNSPLTSYAYEPGSTMKIFSFMAAIENGLYKGDEIYPSGNILVDGYKIKDWNNYGWGNITFDIGFTYSSNTAAVRLAQKLGRDKLTDFYENLGFSKITGIELPNEYNGKIEMVAESELASSAYGQGITTTPIQQIKALTSITNNGVILKPYIISKIIDPQTNNLIYEGKKTELNKVATKETISKIIELMDLTVNSDDPAITGKSYKTDTVTLLGKTGTAQYIDVDGKYTNGNYKNIKSFAGIFPKNDPQYIIYVSIKNYGGSTNDLARIVKSVVESIAKYKNIEDRKTDTDKSKIINISNYINKNKDEVIDNLNQFNLTPIIIGNGNTIINQYPLKETSVITNSKVFLLTNGNEMIMPNVIGWNSSEIISLVNIMKLSYNIDGYGKVIDVSIKPGTIIKPEDILQISLDNRSVVNEKEKAKEE
ncbi:MAG: penicillin-binding transpeptidase domain-containing protein [Bacilli bacterium]|nr:penicillin-binding transpeptidase domain-containing protein [Bacilli bacterium]